MNKNCAPFQEDPSHLHDTLVENLKKEVYLTRELLSNIHQEEISLMLHDAGSLAQVLQQRSSMLEKLSSLRSFRLETTHKIEHLHDLHSADLLSIEIASLNDQLSALTQRMSLQLSQTRRMNEHPDAYSRFALPYLEKKRPQKKTTVITLQVKK
jgi:flagellar biosynthesis/type III secretory pathway chaperone